MRKIILNTLRFVISAGLLIYLVYIADIKKIYQVIRSIDIFYLILAFVIFFGALFLLTRRWQILLNRFHIQPGYSNLLVFYFIGYFFNNFLPTTIGGDVSRAYNVARISGMKAHSVGIILLERAMGLLSTLTLASVSLFWVTEFFATSKIVYVTLAIWLSIVFFLVSIFNQTFYRSACYLLDKIELFSIGNRLKGVLKSVYDYRTHKAVMVRAFLLSVLAQILWIFMNYILTLALRLHDVTLGYLFLVVPVTFVMGLIPSINGLGVRDSGYVFLLTRIGLTPAEAISLSFLNTLVPLVISMIGGFLHIFYRQSAEAKTVEKLKTEIK